MQRQLHPQPIEYAQAIAGLVAQMPLERAVQVYEFVRFLESQPHFPPPIPADDDWLNDSEEEMQAEDKLWDATRALHSEEFSTLATNARTEIAAGTTKPMFRKSGEFVTR